MPTYYVYCYYDPRNDSPIYIGKGTAKKPGDYYRANYHWNHADKVKNLLFKRVLLKIKSLGLSPKISILRVFISEMQAFESERYWIAKYGLRSSRTGTLPNLTFGGDGVLGYQHSEELKKFFAEKTREVFTNPSIRQKHREGLRKAYFKLSKTEQEAIVQRICRGGKVFWENNKEYRSELSKQIMKVRWSDPKTRAEFGKLAKRQWKDPKYRETVISKLRAIAITQTSSPEWRTNHSAKIKALYAASPARRKAAGASLKSYWEKPENAKRRTEQLKARWADPVWRAEMLKKWADGRKRKNSVKGS